MRKNRIIFWVISFVVCTCIIMIYKKQESKLPEDKKTPLKVYCLEEFQPQIKKIIEKSSIGDTHKVIFSDNKEEAEFILTDKVLATDSDYEKVGWTPLIVAIDDRKEKKENYKKEGYLIKEDGKYTIRFDRIIRDTISGKLKEKIYCPKLDTIEGEKFFDFLLINVNNGRYPENTVELYQAEEKVNEFLNCSNVIQLNIIERLINRKEAKDELYIIFEKYLYGEMESSEYDFEVSYPSDTVCYELYFKCQGNNKKELTNIMKKQDFFSGITKLEDIMRNNEIRHKNHIDNYYNRYYKISERFSYLDVPFKEE